MLLKIVCLLTRWLFGLAVLVIRGDGEKNAELLVLQHENAVLRRNAGRVQCEQLTGPGSPRSRGSSRAGAGRKSSLQDADQVPPHNFRVLGVDHPEGGVHAGQLLPG